MSSVKIIESPVPELTTVEQDLQDVLMRFIGEVLGECTRVRLMAAINDLFLRHEQKLGRPIYRPNIVLIEQTGQIIVGDLSDRDFFHLVGRPPEKDDLHRVNCTRVGEIGHMMCGYCAKCSAPRFLCGHF